MKKRMIITRTPLRITFTGGGTDLQSYYKYHSPGAVVNAAINKYIYIIVNKKFDNAIRVSYSRTEIVDSVDKIQHPTVREALKLLDIDGGIEILSISDIPSEGTGLGSSASFLVGLLNALHSWKGEVVSPEELAKEAIHIKTDILKEAEGKQDEYIAAYGGMRLMYFNSDESVEVRPIIMPEDARAMLKSNLMLMYTGMHRRAPDILNKQSSSVSQHLKEYDKMKEITIKLYENLAKGNWKDTGTLLHENWLLKKSLESDISNNEIDMFYKKAIENGAEGGKILGAGGGGFMLLFAPPEKHDQIKKALPELREEDFEFEYLGSRIIFVGD
ncbi:MAG: kinase [Candidatus Micrarchaeia archaeon]